MFSQIHLSKSSLPEHTEQAIIAKLLSNTVSHTTRSLSALERRECSRETYPGTHEAFDRGSTYIIPQGSSCWRNASVIDEDNTWANSSPIWYTFPSVVKGVRASQTNWRLSQKGPLNPLSSSIACDAHLSIAYHMLGRMMEKKIWCRQPPCVLLRNHL